MSKIEKEELDQPKKESRKKRKFFVWIVILLLCIGGYFSWQFLRGKAVGTIRVNNVDAGVPLDKNSENRLYKGKFITFSHRAGYAEKFHRLPESGPVQESLLLSTLDVEGRKIAVTVAYRGTNDFMSDPSFQMRQGTPEEYRSKKFEEGVWQGVLFEKNTSPFEKTVFFAKSGYILSISVISPFSGDDIEDELHMIIRNLTFSFE